MVFCRNCIMLFSRSASPRFNLVPFVAATSRRLNSNAAATAPVDNPSATSFKVHNPQFDESGKELTVDITDKTVRQLKHIAVRDQNPLQALRITVDSGGCHGYQYLMDLTDTVNEDDVIFEKDGARVVIDTITLPMISGSRIDFIEELIGSAFKILNNPHAAHSCGCDTSFEIKI
ncbi:[4Fe-4S] proteins maturation [Modicella reniformis]|uniref:[4Fe-4S] proteins maturation n=1 Tax=Modicella reniformis TaxID=1440133 RepID=A0A9P6IPD9_9FUNG|nr:[4Fe-4S] proteins maturation [Modicella reniformis]